MGMFDGIEAVSSTQGGAWLSPGRHTLKILALKQPEGLRAGNCFIAELSVIDSSNEAHPPGQALSWVRNITKHPEMALGDVKAFLAAAYGCEEGEVTKKAANEAVGLEQPLAGVSVKCDAFNRPTKVGGEFTVTRWSSVE